MLTQFVMRRVRQINGVIERLVGKRSQGDLLVGKNGRLGGPAAR
jgi:hypothetical protein